MMDGVNRYMTPRLTFAPRYPEQQGILLCCRCCACAHAHMWPLWSADTSLPQALPFLTAAEPCAATTSPHGRCQADCGSLVAAVLAARWRENLCS